MDFEVRGVVADSWGRARRILDVAGLPPDDLTHVRALTGGTYNTVEELLLGDGSRYVLKVPPAEDLPGLRWSPRRSSTGRRPPPGSRRPGWWPPPRGNC